MTDDLRSLANDAVATPGWRWKPGMLTRNGDRIKVAAQYDDGRWRLDTSNSESIYNTGLDDAWKCDWYDIKTGRDREMVVDAPLPDLIDVATGGCMLALLGPCCVTVYRDSVVVTAGDFVVLRAATLAEACTRLARARGYWTKD